MTDLELFKIPMFLKTVHSLDPDIHVFFDFQEDQSTEHVMQIQLKNKFHMYT